VKRKKSGSSWPALGVRRNVLTPARVEVEFVSNMNPKDANSNTQDLNGPVIVENLNENTKNGGPG